METVFASDLELEGELCTLASSMQLLAMCGRPPGGRPEGEGEVGRPRKICTPGHRVSGQSRV